MSRALCEHYADRDSCPICPLEERVSRLEAQIERILNLDAQPERQ